MLAAMTIKFQCEWRGSFLHSVMWQSEQEVNNSAGPSRSSNGKSKPTKHASSTTNLARSQSSTSLLKRAISFQFLSRNTESVVDREKRAFIKMRYKDISKYVIWPSCRLPDQKDFPKNPPLVPTSPKDPRTVLLQPELEDHRSPYLPCTINHVLRSDSEDSSDAEQVLEMTRCSTPENN
ncbi:unnamed protein product [Caenorhabditis auriculariae]|uniref:Uncharacterized protein n=1 Tax=Caenorhabditis auriculariae TaxID=2777116 RepID=A0A8S1H0P5_9PELO|nr:unnamed protein product [Caenorhabditis auriculariae]